MPKKEAKSQESLYDRAETAKNLGLSGGIEELEKLIELSQNDDSPAIRMRAAEAAAHILSRLRIGPDRELLSSGRRRQLLDQFRGVDPLSNPGLFPFLACLDLPRCLPRILVGLRDPRYDVRLTAILGLRRFCCSWSRSGDRTAEAKVVAVLSDPRIRPDVLASVSELVSACGWQSSRPALVKLCAREDQAGYAAEAALEILDGLALESGIHGVWRSTGLDAGEVSQNPRPIAWWLWNDEGGMRMEAGSKPVFFRGKLSGPTELQMVVGRTKSTEEIRRLWLSQNDDDHSTAVLQIDERTYFQAEADAPLRIVEAFVALRSRPKTICEKMAAFMIPVLEEAGADGTLAIAQLERLRGQPLVAVGRIQALIDGASKAKPNWFFHLGESFLEAGDVKKGHAALRKYLKVAAQKAPNRGAAEALLERS